MIPIAFYRTLLSRLFGDEPEKETQEAQEAPPQQDAGPPPPAPRELALPQDHPICQLWSLHAFTAKRLPQPRLCLTDPPDLPLDDQEAEKELARLQSAVADSAGSRLALLDSGRASDLDAQVVVFTAASGMAAWLLVYPPAGQGAEVSREMLDRALAESKVSWGLDEALLESLPQDPERYFHLFLCAWGKSAIQGLDGRVVDLFPRVLERSVAVDENNRVDYNTLNFFQNVTQGDVICKLIPPTEGVEGRTVTDQPIPARDGKKASLPKGRHTEISEDGMSLLASSSGHVEFSGRGFQVKPVLEISGNVDFSTGDLDFLGDINICGNVLSGFTVRAMGNIHIAGVVEAGSTVEAGGDLTVVKGILGDGPTTVRAQRCIFSKYIENATIYVRENLQTDCIVNGQIYCDGEIQGCSGRGSIMGGKVWAGRRVRANAVGSQSECKTSISLGGSPCASFEREMAHREVNDLEMEIERLACQPESPVRASLAAKAKLKLMTAEMKLRQIEEKAPIPVEDDGGEGGRLESAVVYPGTKVRIGDEVLRLRHVERRCVITMFHGEIVVM